MSTIHCREVNGKKRYRLWSSIVDGYLTPELTERQLKAALRSEALRLAEMEFESTFPERLERAQKHGTSALWPALPAGKHDPWDAERTPYTGDT